MVDEYDLGIVADRSSHARASNLVKSRKEYDRTEATEWRHGSAKEREVKDVLVIACAFTQTWHMKKNVPVPDNVIVLNVEHIPIGPKG